MSESGWTMYIGSHISGTDQELYCSYNGKSGVDPESDDSMASDASSGPSHQEAPCGSGGSGRRRADCVKNCEEEGDKYSKESFSGKSKKHGKQKDERRVKVEKEKEKEKPSSVKVSSAGSFVGSKLRKKK